jgi:hypothetical protein
MKLFSLRKRTARHARPYHRADVPDISPQDVTIAHWHGYNVAQWCVLPALVQVDKRESFYTARGL